MLSRPTPTYETLAEWIAREAIPFSLDSAERFNAAVDMVMTSLGATVELLGLGEALHGGQGLLTQHNGHLKRGRAAWQLGATNSSYFPLTSQSFTDFDWLAVVGDG